MFHLARHSRRPAIRCLAWIAPVLAALWVATGMIQDRPAAPQPPRPGQPIKRIEIADLHHVAEAYVRSVLKVKVGDAYDPKAIEDDVTRLVKTGKFETARAEPWMENGKAIVVFRVLERPVVEGVEFSGNLKFKTKDLVAEVDLSPGRPISEFAIRQAETALERKYKEAGYHYAKVEVDAERLKSERVVAFNISEGPRVKVRRIRFEGNSAFSPTKLRSKIETATYIWIFRTGDYDEDRAERDAAALQNFYKDEGYLDARAGYRAEFAANGTDLTLTFVIDEGVQYSIKTVTFKGNTVISSEELGGKIRLQPGSVLKGETLRNDVKHLTEEYGQLGYIYADARSDWVYSSEEGYVDLTLTIAEREQYRFGRIVVRGNSQTKDKVVRRELRFFPEDIYNTVAVHEAENRLVETRLFKTATIQPVGDTPGVRDALVRVEEAETTSILFGVGVTSNSGLVGSVTIENRNFDLFDTPRSLGELFRGRAFKGAGQIFRLQFEPGTELTRGRIDFREPYFLDQDLGFGTGLYLFERKRDEWDERRVGFNFSFDRRFRTGLLKDWAAEAAFRFENIKISDTDWLTAQEIRDVRGDNWLTSVKGTLVRDTTDSRFQPTRGNRFSVSYEQAGAFGGDSSFGKLVADATQHFTLLTDTMDRKHVLSVGATAGQILGDAPVFEKFYGGGIGSVRGFEYRGISPRAGWRSDRVGGDFELLANAEYSFPVVGQTVRGVTFLDMGTVEQDFGINSWRASVGIGARIYIKPFGPIPLAFDLAWPVAKEDEDDTQVFSFSFGTTF